MIINFATPIKSSNQNHQLWSEIKHYGSLDINRRYSNSIGYSDRTRKLEDSLKCKTIDLEKKKSSDPNLLDMSSHERVEPTIIQETRHT